MASERSQRRIERLLDEADEAAAHLDWETVRTRAQAVLAFDSQNDDAAELLAAADRAVGEDVAPKATERPSSHTVAVTSAVSDQPTSFGDGRYQVRRFLGEGGKKKVYLAHDTTLDREVAFSLIKTEGLDETGRTRITREAQAMGRLGTHPNIVTVFDLGEHPSTSPEQGTPQPYMVCELMGGGDVEGLIEDAPDHRMPLEQAISIASETCRGLEFAHDRGIVHRDLKPGNVWLTEDGTAKIGDFGRAVATDRSRLTQEGMMVGTVSYMPPEQAMGSEVTPKADLYSLGAMLYEMVCGRPPFLGDDSIAIIGQHVNTPPVAPTWHNSTCPRPLEALILRLLAKDPSERPGSAADVLAALDGIDPAAELAHHFSQAEAVVGSERLVRYSLLAAERALAAYANEEAVEHFERALSAKEDQPMDAETAAVLFGLGRARAATVPVDEMHHAVASLSRAFDYYVESGDVARAVAIVEYPKDLQQFLSGMDELGRLVDRAVELYRPIPGRRGASWPARSECWAC